MIISGVGFTSFNAKIQRDFTPNTTLALQWAQGSDGNWNATDRGADNDSYECDIKIYKDETTINAFVAAVEANRVEVSDTTQTCILNLSGFNAQEKIFGADVDYSGTISATAFVSRRIQNTWKGWSLSIKLVASLPTFIGGSGSLPLLRFIDMGVDADSDYTINKIDSYNRTTFYQDHSADTGTFTGTITFTNEEMIGLRALLRTTRGGTITVPASGLRGIAFPFGRRLVTPPFSVKVTSWHDLGMLSMAGSQPRWRTTLTLAQVN